MNKSFLIADVKAVDTEEPSGGFEAVISAPTLDRDGEVIAAGAFAAKSPLPESIPIHINHEFDVEKVVGRAVPYYDGDILKVKGVFDADERSQLVRSKVMSGSVNRMSVGFMGASKETKDGIQTITAAELLEASFVSVSSNREAAVLAVKGLTCPTCAARAAADGEEEKSVDGEDAPGADPAVESSREDAPGAGGDDEQQHLELRAYALRLLAGSVT